MLAEFVLPGPWMTATQSLWQRQPLARTLSDSWAWSTPCFQTNSTVLRWLYAAVRAPPQEEVVCGVDVRQDDLLENSAELTN